jgi:hypothetical protein
MFFHCFYFYSTEMNVIRDDENKTLCDSWLERHLFNSTERHYFNLTFHLIQFDSFDDLSAKECSKTTFKIIESNLKLYARKALFFENDFDLKNILSMFPFSRYSKTENTLNIVNMLGFNLNSNTTTINNFLDHVNVNMENVRFEFYLNKKLITKDMCKQSLFSNRNLNYFGTIRRLSFSDIVFYSNQVCPYVFMNSNLIELSLFYMSNSLLNRNLLRFSRLNESISLNMRSFIYFQLSLVYSAINVDLVNEQVFRNARIMHFSGIIEGIESNFFVHFKRINFVILTFENFR